MRANRLLLVVILLVSARGTLAHHSFLTTYDPSRSTEITGVVADYELKSPHSFIYLDVISEDGLVERVDVEMGALPIMRRRGFDEDTLEPGDQVSIVAWPHRVSNVPMVWGRSVRTQEGVVLGDDPTRAGVESEHRESAGIERLEGRWLPPVPRVGSESPLPLTPAGLMAWRNYDPKQSPANTCEPNNVPAVFHTPYLFEIRTTTQEAVIHHEAYNVTRTVPLHSEPIPAEPSGMFGIATGRIENDELVIESSAYPESAWGLGVAGGTTGAGADVPSSSQKKVTERYSVSSDGGTLTVNYTLEDPIYLTEPYSSHVELARVADDEPLHDYACEPDNAARFSRYD